MSDIGAAKERKRELNLGGQTIRILPEELKAGGIIPQRQKGMVTVRFAAPGGRVEAKHMAKIAELADKYGRGYLHFTFRQSPEIPFVRLEDVEALVAEAGEVGASIAGCGKRVRVPTACAGCEYNPNGLVNTQDMARESYERYFGMDHSHKFKLSFSGCPVDCARARENDLGFQGQVEPYLNPDNCTGCSLCVQACQDDALYMDPSIEGPRTKRGMPVRIEEQCISCGDCIKACAFDAMLPQRTGNAVYSGGKHGKHPHVAYPIAEFVPEEKVYDVIEAVMAWYRENGKKGERIGVTIDRIGINSLRRALKDVIGEYLLQQEDIEKPRWRKVFFHGVADALPEYEQV